MMKKTVLSILATAFVVSSYAQNVTIPDDNFKTCLLTHANLNTVDDGEISEAEASVYTGSIVCKDKGIKDLTGISYFTKIDKLGIRDNQLTTLDISSNTLLTNLGCKNNSLNDLNIANGNNVVLLKINAIGNPNLTCIEVDDVTAIAAGWQKDITASYSEDCSSTTGLFSSTEQTDFSIFPNPVSNQVTLDFDITTVNKITVLDVNGNTVKMIEVGTSINVSELAKGVYVLQLQTNSGILHSRFVKE